LFIGPVFGRELVTAPRRPQLYLLRTAYVGGLLVLMFTAWLVLTGSHDVRNVSDFARFGSTVFQLLTVVQLALAVFFSALFTAAAVSQEKDRRTLKFRCPAAAFGLQCQNQEACRRLLPDQGFGRTIRVPLERDRRRILPVYPHGTRFEKAYKKRTSIERFFFRLDHFYGFERNSAVGLKQMRLRTAMGFIGVLATAVGWIAAKEPGKMRSLFQAA
jgi:hypothetical protein